MISKLSDRTSTTCVYSELFVKEVKKKTNGFLEPQLWCSFVIYSCSLLPSMKTLPEVELDDEIADPYV